MKYLYISEVFINFSLSRA